MNILFDLLIFSLPLGVITKISVAPGVAFYLYDFAAGLISAFLLIKLLLLKKQIKYKKLGVLLMLFATIGFVSLLLNLPRLNMNNFFISFLYLLRWVSYMSIIFAVQFLSKNYVNTINTKLILVGTFFVIAGFTQYHFYPDLSNLFYLGWDEHLYRLFSTMLDPNFAGSFLVLFFVLLTGIFIKRDKDNKLAAVVTFCIWSATLVAIILTYSRSAFVMLVVSIFFLLVIHKLYKQTVVIILIFIGLFFIYSDKRIEGLNPLRIVSAEARITSMSEALKIISYNPVLGVGFNSYRYAQTWYGTRKGENMMRSHADAGTDNSYLFVMATTGVVGFLIFMDFWLNVIKLILEKIKTTTSIYPAVALASVLGIAINTIFINSLFFPPIMGWLFVVIGLGLSSSSEDKKRKTKVSKLR